MKKNIFIIVSIVCIACLALAGCGKKNDFSFDESLLTLSDETVITAGSHIEIDKSSYTTTDFKTRESVKTDAQVTINKVGTGSKCDDFINAFGLNKNYAMWETYIDRGSGEVIVNYESFSGEIGYGAYDDRFLTVGFMLKEDGVWEEMYFNTLHDVWYTTASNDAFGTIALISAGFDKEGTITKIVVDYGE